MTPEIFFAERPSPPTRSTSLRTLAKEDSVFLKPEVEAEAIFSEITCCQCSKAESDAAP